MIRFASIGSGSQGNCLVVESTDGMKTTRVLIDCGFPIRRTLERLTALGIEPSTLTGILISHEHLDHIRGAPSLARRFNIPLWMNSGTHKASRKKLSPGWVNVFDSHAPFELGNFQVTPIPIPHDAREPVQFHLTDGNHKLVNLTDLGAITPFIAQISAGCDAMVIECNHDLDMLKNGKYHAALKRRVAGQLGHLSNDAASDFVASIHHPKLQHLVAAHLSQENNLPELAQAALAKAVGAGVSEIEIASQAEGFNWRHLM